MPAEAQTQGSPAVGFGTTSAFATDAGHTAQDGAGTNGLYTVELLKHLQTPGLTIEQVFKRTRAGVME